MNTQQLDVVLVKDEPKPGVDDLRVLQDVQLALVGGGIADPVFA